MLSPEAHFNAALAAHQSGRLAEAEALYRQLLAQHPNHAGTLHLLGVLNFQQRKMNEAVELISRAIELDPSNPVPHNNLSAVLREMGRPEEAIASANRALALVPNYADALVNIGNALRDIGKRDKSEMMLEQAMGVYARAVAAAPQNLSALHNLGTTERDLKFFDRAIATFTGLMQMQPKLAAGWHGLALSYQGNLQIDEALAAYERAIALDPGNAELNCNYGVALETAGRLDEALRAYDKAIASRPDFAAVYMNIGAVLQRQGKMDQALAMTEKSNALAPNHAATIRNLAVVYNDLGRFDDAIGAFRQSLALDPTDASAHFLFGMSLLCKGDFENGWREYHWRLKAPEFRRQEYQFNRPEWGGEDLTGKTILLYMEQGLGDAIHMIRYAPRVAKMARKVLIACQPELLTIFRRCFPELTFLVASEPVPPFDFHCPLLTLPQIFSMRLETIPAEGPYLSANPNDVAAWRERIPKGPLNVGLVWAGNKNHKNDHNRSMTLEMLAPLADLPGVRFHSLQVGQRGLAGVASPLPMVDLAPQLTDFSQTAAALEALDLLISVDTSVVHLAGALGRPVWMLVPLAPDWRWLHGRTDSPWYPTLRLFRQTERKQWGPVVEQVRAALEVMK